MDDKAQFFQDDDCNFSAMRLYCFIALIQAVSLTWYGVANGTISQLMPAIWTFMVGAFAPKAIQKFAEVWLKEKTIVAEQSCQPKKP